MKKTMSRLLTFVLVLALLVSAIPFALADETGGTVTITDKPTENLVLSAGGAVSTTLHATATAAQGYTAGEVSWSCTGDASVTGGVFTATKAGDYTVTASVEFTNDTDGSKATDTDTCTIKVVEADPEPATPTEITITGEHKMFTGTQQKLTATVLPEGVPQDVIWTHEGAVTVDKSGNVTAGENAGTATVTATAKDHPEVKATFTIEVVSDNYTATLSQTSLSLKVNEKSDKLTVTVKDANEQTVTQGVDVVWGPDKPDIATVSGGVVTGVKAGTAVITATVTVNEKVVDTLECTVTVGEDSIVCEGGSAQANGRDTVTLKPALASGLTDGVTYSFTASEGCTVGSTSGIATSTRAGIYTITVTATKDQKTLAVKEVKVSFYDVEDITVTLKDGVSTLKLGDTGKYASVVGKTSVPATWSIATGILSGLNDEIAKYVGLFPSASTNSGGTLTPPVSTNFGLSKITEGNLKNVVFTVNPSGTGKYVADYEVLGNDDLVVKRGQLTIYSDYTGNITYSTSYNSKLIFNVSDFSKFWTEQKSANSLTGSLSYVTFEDMVVGKNPKYGELYCDTACKTEVSPSKDKFYISSSTGYLLDNVTYKPDPTVTFATTVQIPFTAVSTTGSKAYGVIAINLNQETTTITAYGVQFGNGTNSISDYIADIFKTETGYNLSYVTFPSLSASTGKLLYDFSGVLDSREVLSTDKFYADASSSQLDLDDVVFVPRAGLYGNVTIYYKAYSSSATKEYSGTIVLNVKEKTASSEFKDVTSSSYSWAADSVDFLSYEGIAQGSNGKYNPASNITRGDFMLMLYRAFLEDEYGDTDVTSNFSDVTKGTTTYSKETYQAVGVAKKLGIAQGTNGKFNPKSYITRQEAMTLIYRTLDEVNYDLEYTVSTDTSDFKDYSSVASYAKTAISDLIGHGIVIGNNGKINPKSNITRAEMAVILHRVLTY